MKRSMIILLFIIAFLSVTACKDEITNIKTEETKGTDIATEITPDYPCFTLEKQNFIQGERIKLSLHNTDNRDWVALTEYGKEPSSKYIINKKNVLDNTELEFSTSKLENVGDFTLFLLDDGSYDVLYRIDIHIDNENQNNYSVEKASINYEKEGYSIRTTINIDTPHQDELTYRLYWAKDGKRLDGYMALKTIISSETETIKIPLNDNLLMPNEANQIEIAVVEGVSDSYYLDMDETLKAKESNLLFTFNAISDLHIQSLRDSMVFNSHLKMMLEDIYQSKSEAIFVVGDSTNFGKPENYQYLKGIVDGVENPNGIPMYQVIGNHEYMYHDNMTDALNLFKEQYELESHYYSVVLNGYKFIVLGSESLNQKGEMSQTQLKWFKEELNSTDFNTPTFIFIHQPLKDTVAGSLFSKYGQTDYGFSNVNEEIRTELKKHPNAFVFSGHTHYTLDEIQPTLYGNGLDATFVNTASNGYLVSSKVNDVGGGEGLYIEVYEEYIIIKGKEIVYDRWIAGAQFIFPLTK